MALFRRKTDVIFIKRHGKASRNAISGCSEGWEVKEP